MKQRPFHRPLLIAGILVGCSALAETGHSAVPFPEGYRQWVHIKSTMVGPQHSSFKEPCTDPCIGGVFQFYANTKALEGYRTGKFPDGAVIADEFIELRSITNQPGVSIEGPRRGVGMMVKDSQEYAKTGGWLFETFKGDSRTEGRLSDKDTAACYGCHTSRKDHDFVFSNYKE